MSRVYFSSDWHIGHKNIHKFRHPSNGFPLTFSDEAEHREWLFDWVVKHVTKRDTMYLLGDVAFSEEALEAVSKLPGRKVLVKGNHDLIKHPRESQVYDQILGLGKYKKYWLSHAPVHPQEIRGRVNLHGHCVSESTEILTKRGWKKYNEVVIGEEVYSLNLTSGNLEDDVIKDIILKPNYSGKSYKLKSKGLDMEVTDQHRVLFRGYKSRYRYSKAECFSKRGLVVLPRSGYYDNFGGVDLGDNLLRLYIQLAADGNITESGLFRFRLSKKRKIDRVEYLLSKLSIDFTKNVDKTGMTTINFRSNLLSGWNIKGLDNKLINCNWHQCAIIKDEYSRSDGNRDLIFTSKESEVDILSHMFTINGYIVTTHMRSGHGFSVKPSYQLNVTSGTERGVSKVKDRIESVDNNGRLFWCVDTNNTNFIARNNGTIFITGNCHGQTVPDHRYYNCCVEHLMARFHTPLATIEDIKIDIELRKYQEGYSEWTS